MKIQMTKLHLPLFVSFMLMIVSVSLTASFDVSANASAGTKAKPKEIMPVDVEMKCHVELMGGGETISFTNVPYSSTKDLKSVLIGQEIKLTSESSAQAIYKVKECVPLEDKFKGRKAQQLFLDTPQ